MSAIRMCIMGAGNQFGRFGVFHSCVIDISDGYSFVDISWTGTCARSQNCVAEFVSDKFLKILFLFHGLVQIKIYFSMNGFLMKFQTAFKGHKRINENNFVDGYG